jgi:hypothetical protein
MDDFYLFHLSLIFETVSDIFSPSFDRTRVPEFIVLPLPALLAIRLREAPRHALQHASVSPL